MTVPEAARALGLPGGDVYRLIFDGELAGGPGTDGSVYVSATSVQQYLSAGSRSSSPPGDR
jgi:hypothetical protein